MVGLFNQKFYNDIFISSIVHSETQYGKTLLDAHFATANRHLINFMKTWQENKVTKINSPKGLAWALSFNKGVKNSMIQLVDFDCETLDKIQAVFKEAIGKCAEFYSRANFIGFKKMLPDTDLLTESFNSLGCVKSAKLRWKVRAFSNVKPSVQFKVDMTSDNLVTVDKKTQTLIVDILERDYNHNQVSDINPSPQKHQRRYEKPKLNMLHTFDSDYDYDCLPMKKIQDDNETIKENDFSFYRYSRKSKHDLSEKLGAVGALDLLRNTVDSDHVVQFNNSDDEDEDSDYTGEDDCNSTINDDYEEDLDTYYLSLDDYRAYGNPSEDLFPVDDSLTGTTVLKFQPLGVIRKQNSKSQKQSNIAKKHMLKGVVEQAVVLAKDFILTSDQFRNRHDLDPIVNDAKDFKMSPFESGWARRKARGNIYGDSYISLYESELTEMFQMGVQYSYNKMSAGRMRENLRSTYLDRFSIPGETQIKQFINKMSESQKRSAANPGKPKSNRGRKPGNVKTTWHVRLRDILERNLKEKPRNIYEEFITSYGGRYPKDLPMKDKTNEPDDTKIKQALQRFKRNIESKVRKEVLM